MGAESGIATDLKDTIANLKSISRKIDQGEGTMGSIINDPLLYDKINSILGEAERSKFVRATIKYLIEQRIKQEQAQEQAIP